MSAALFLICRACLCMEWTSMVSEFTRFRSIISRGYTCKRRVIQRLRSRFWNMPRKVEPRFLLPSIHGMRHLGVPRIQSSSDKILSGAFTSWRNRLSRIGRAKALDWVSFALLGNSYSVTRPPWPEFHTWLNSLMFGKVGTCNKVLDPFSSSCHRPTLLHPPCSNSLPTTTCWHLPPHSVWWSLVALMVVSQQLSIYGIWHKLGFLASTMRTMGHLHLKKFKSKPPLSTSATDIVCRPWKILKSALNQSVNLICWQIILSDPRSPCSARNSPLNRGLAFRIFLQFSHLTSRLFRAL